MDSLPYLPAAEQQALLDGPALAPPAGVVSNFDNPPNNNGLAQGVIATCITVATLCLVARVYTKLFCVRKFKLEDCNSLGPPYLRTTLLTIIQDLTCAAYACRALPEVLLCRN